MHRLFDLTGRKALVTGASRGIGRAIALGLAEAGADVAIHCARRREDAARVAEEARALGGQPAVVVGDLGTADGAGAVVAQALDALGRVDILVANASVQTAQPWLEVTAEAFDRQVAVNLRATMELLQGVVPGMVERRWGRVLTIGSVQQVRPSPHLLVYAATKAAQLSLVQNLARQVGRQGVTVNNLAPGAIDTERNAATLATPGAREKWNALIPAGYVGQPEDCVGAALVLCSEAGRYVTGADWRVDGGLALP